MKALHSAQVKLTYWNAKPNFGDQLNVWLWERLLPNFFDGDDATLFMGIGSILFDDYPAAAKKIVFGSGYGGYTPPPVIDDSWTVLFVRGPRTAETLGLDRDLGIGDPAMLLAMLDEVRDLPRRVAGVAFMPHWESAVDGAWERAARIAGFRYIDPRWNVERVLEEIAASRMLVTQAMHGAIVADALRIPVVPFLPAKHHRMKWYDWADAMDLRLSFARSSPSTLLDLLILIFDGRPKRLKWLRENPVLRGIGAIDAPFTYAAARALKRAARRKPLLSTDSVHERALSMMVAKLYRLRRTYRRHPVCAPN